MGPSLQRIATAVLISSLALFTLIAILSIWDVFSDDIAYKSITTIAVTAFSSLVILGISRIINRKNDQLPPQ